MHIKGFEIVDIILVIDNLDGVIIVVLLVYEYFNTNWTPLSSHFVAIFVEPGKMEAATGENANGAINDMVDDNAAHEAATTEANEVKL